ncbi:MAG: hypothetical protein ACR2MO_02305 [Acidimicrobiales bacterium]
MGRLRAALIVLAVAVTGACKGSGAESPEPTVPTAPSTTTIAATATTAPNPFAVPETIDAAYVDRVLVELNKVYGDVGRKIRATGQYQRSDLDPLGAIFNDPLLELQVEEFGKISTMDASSFKVPLGDRRLTVEELITARPDCVFAGVRLDVSAVAANPPPVRTIYLTLRPTQAGANPKGVNSTPWSMSGESDVRQDQCVA